MLFFQDVAEMGVFFDFIHFFVFIHRKIMLILALSREFGK